MIYKNINTNVSTKYYVDYVIEKTMDGTITGAYYQLVRTNDEAILFAHKQLTYIKAFCFDCNISTKEITIL